MNLKSIKIILFLFLPTIFVKSQITEDYYKDRISKEYTYSFDNIKTFAKGDNSYNYIALGYFINANNIMYEKTKERYYLDCNIEILTPMFLNLKKNEDPKKRLMKVKSSNQNFWINGEESLTFEGYFYRYLGEFIYLINQNNLYKDKQQKLLNGLEYGFNKWYDISYDKYKDASRLYHLRLHIGANWAVTSLYLYQFKKEEKYRLFYSEFDKQLKNNLKIKFVDNNECYIWNSTYSEQFINSLKNKNIQPEIQDVNHGNHVVEYMLTSYQLNKGVYTKKDLFRLGNTVIYLMWNKNTLKFSDNIDGTSSSNKEMKGSGWKQSDGFMKLMDYNSNLRPIYEEYYKSNKKRVENSSLGFQFLANLYH